MTPVLTDIAAKVRKTIESADPAESPTNYRETYGTNSKTFFGQLDQKIINDGQ